ncbi:GH25 family lysozyme [Paracoccus sp. p4-l81]|uniref:glycoside hydrolase family 25 protein n=1 Tax=unclassified Paracoccus (in: a-proteobacteria) TaxID=2688777 RepID=UPI0035BACCC9
MTRPLRALFSVLFVVMLGLGLAACGGHRGGYPSAPAGVGPNFGDRKPHPWSFRPPTTYPVHGIDVSRWQAGIDWGAARNSGVSFAFIKATEGGDVADPMFLANWIATQRAGVMRGAYHFYYFCRTPEEQAAWFIRHVPRSSGSLPPVLDMEWTNSRNCPGRPAPAVVRDHANRFLNALERHYGQRPIFYTTPDFYADNDLGQLRAEFWLRSVADHPSVRYPNERWTFWQYTGTGIVPGVNGDTDINVFAGNVASYQRWLKQRTVR